MSHPRRLSFAVGTTLLTASLSMTVGCEKGAPDTEPPHVNEGPEPEGDPETEPEVMTNPGPAVEPGDEDAADEPEHVNTVPDSE